MWNKKPTAIGVKFTKTPPKKSKDKDYDEDMITNMEGALHTFVNPIVRAFMHGDYAFDTVNHSHTVVRFGIDAESKMHIVREVLISALVQPDFEFQTVMFKVACLSATEVVGRKTIPRPMKADSKQIDAKRSIYDNELRRFMIWHLTAAHKLPGLAETEKTGTCMTPATARGCITAAIRNDDDPADALKDTFLRFSNTHVLSLELMFNSALQQVRNELLALEALCPQGYVYTWDPPSVFAQAIGGAEILNRLHCAAMKSFLHSHKLTRMRVFAFNDYADRAMLNCFGYAFAGQDGVVVCAKSMLFLGEGGLYHVPDEFKGAVLVLHNNSDGFGQNIEFEGPGGNLDGAVGVNGSAAASLCADREDLFEHVMFN